MAASVKVSGCPLRARLCLSTSWRLTETGHNQFSISRNEAGEDQRFMDVWQVRERFLKIKTAEDMRDFFSEFGPIQSAVEGVNRIEPSQEEITTVDFATVRRIQLLFKKFMEDEKWYLRKPVLFDNKALSLEQVAQLSRIWRGAVLKGYPSPSFTLKMGYASVGKDRLPSPYLDYTAADVYGAVYASIYIDKMRGLRARVCEREGCTNAFLTTDPRRRFCHDGPSDCSAILRMRKKRSAERLVKAKARAEQEKKTQPLRNRKTTRRVK
jgi:hypothetical protein